MNALQRYRVKRALRAIKRTRPTHHGSGSFKLVAAAACGLILLFATTKVVEGLILASLVVLAVMCTFGFAWVRAFAISRVGYPITIVVTTVLAHQIIGTSSVAGLFAVAWALILKMFVLDVLRWLHRHQTGEQKHELVPEA